LQPVDAPIDADVALVEAARDGDVAAFETLVDKYRDRVYGLALRMTRTEADAAEITQDTFLNAYQHLGELQGDNLKAFGSWLTRIAANQSLMRLRHRKVASQVEQSLDEPTFNERGSLVDDVADWRLDALGQTLDNELREAIQKATDQLPEEHRRVFLLRDLDGLSYEEIAEITGESVPAIKSRLHRARLALRAAIDQFYQDVE
jgi:RNA polymerase sigma-70 factor (ECF subfamily)